MALKAPGPFALLSRHVMAHLARGSGSCWWFSGKNRGPTRATAAWICDVDVGDSWYGRNVIGEILTVTPNTNQTYTKVIHITILNSRLYVHIYIHRIWDFKLFFLKKNTHGGDLGDGSH